MDLLNRNSLNKQFNLVIDNTPWPEAMNSTEVFSPVSVKQIRDGRKQDVDLMFSLEMKYVETSFHIRMIQSMSVWMVLLIIGLIYSICRYKRLKKKLAKIEHDRPTR
tara:strand:- start:57 stop:377 length:321 start_codon:yes stop_codon:yes gene_type:complete